MNPDRRFPELAKAASAVLVAFCSAWGTGTPRQSLPVAAHGLVGCRIPGAEHAAFPHGSLQCLSRAPSNGTQLSSASSQLMYGLN